MAKRKYIDWDSIEQLYRAGSLSLNEICAQYEADHVNSQVWKTTVTHVAIIKKAKQKSWTRNFAEKVQKRIKEKLVTSLVTSSVTGNKISDDEYIETAADVGTNVQLRHRVEIRALCELEETFLIELGAKPQRGQFASFQGDISSIDVDLTVSEKAKTLKDLAAVRAQRIALERQAYNIKDDAEPDDGKKRDMVWTVNAIRPGGGNP